MKHNKIFIAFLVVLIVSVFAFSEELPPDVPTEIQYFAVIDGQQTGPYTASDLQDLYVSGRINKATLVWNQSMTDWTPISNVAELRSISQKKQVIQPSINNRDNTTDEDFSRAGLRDDEKTYLYKKNLSSDVTNQAAMRAKFNKQLSSGIVLAALGGVFSTSGPILLGVGLFNYSNSLFGLSYNKTSASISDPESIGTATFVFGICTPLGITFTIAGIILGPLCAIPFSNAGKIASIYKKINKSSLFSVLSRTNIGGGYDWENKKANVVVAIKL